MLSHFFKPRRRIGAHNSLLDHPEHWHWDSGVKMHTPLGSYYFQGNMPLAIKFSSQTLLKSTGQDTVEHLCARYIFIYYIPNIATIGFGVFAKRRKVYEHGYHLKSPLIVLLFSIKLALIFLVFVFFFCVFCLF